MARRAKLLFQRVEPPQDVLQGFGHRRLSSVVVNDQEQQSAKFVEREWTRMIAIYFGELADTCNWLNTGDSNLTK